jgi:hypothetical protein
VPSDEDIYNLENGPTIHYLSCLLSVGMSAVVKYKEKNKTGSKIKNIGSNWLIINFRMGMAG